MDERVKNGGIAGALAFVLLSVIGILYPEIAEKIPTGFESAITVIFSTFVAWAKPRTVNIRPS